MKITKAQKDALDVVMKLTDSDDPNKKEYILTLICGILNLELEEDKTTIPINPNNGSDKIHINIPDWGKPTPIPPFVPGDVVYPNQPPFPPQVWYNNEPEPIQTDAREDVRYVTEITCTGDKNGIVHTTNTADVRYNGDFRNEQTSFNDK